MFEYWPWLSLGALGAYHGLNPAMGWLFAVALGLQERSRTAVLQAFAPIALGHAASIALVVALLAAAGEMVEPRALGLVSAAVLLVFGLYRIVTRGAHPRWVGMRVNFRDLTAWSFLMATAHGAGLMLIPVLLRHHTGMDAGHHATHAASIATTGVSAPAGAALAIGIHTAAMFAVMAVIALIVYEKVGLHLLRRVWWNLDHLWTGVILLTGLLTLMLYAF